MPDLNTFINHFRAGFQPENRFLCQIQTATIYNAIQSKALATSRSGIGGLIEDVFSTLLGEGQTDVQFASDLLSRGLLCHAVRLPGRSFATTEQLMYGFPERFPVGSDYLPISCSFSMPLFGAQNPVINSLENFALDSLLPSNIHVNLNNPATNPLPIFFSAWQNLMQNATDGPSSGFNLGFPADYYTTMQIVLFDKQDNATLTYLLDKVYPVAVESTGLTWESSQSFAPLAVTFNYSHWRIVKTNPATLNINLNISTPFGNF